MDRSLREMGVRDLGVPKKIQKMGNAFFGLMTSLNEAMDRDDRPEVEAVLQRNLFEPGQAPPMEVLSNYLFAQSEQMNAIAASEIIGGKLNTGAPHERSIRSHANRRCQHPARFDAQ